VYIFFKCLILNDESRKINTLLFTVFNERWPRDTIYPQKLALQVAVARSV
jgi:hypothetical protein